VVVAAPLVDGFGIPDEWLGASIATGSRPSATVLPVPLK